MTAEFRLTPRAAADLDEIADHTFEGWGPAQMEDYLRSTCFWVQFWLQIVLDTLGFRRTCTDSNFKIHR